MASTPLLCVRGLNTSKFKHFIYINITHLYCQKLNKKENFKKGNSQPHRFVTSENRFVTSLKGHLIISFLRKFAFLRQKNDKLKRYDF